MKNYRVILILSVFLSICVFGCKKPGKSPDFIRAIKAKTEVRPSENYRYYSIETETRGSVSIQSGVLALNGAQKIPIKYFHQTLVKSEHAILYLQHSEKLNPFIENEAFILCGLGFNVMILKIGSIRPPHLRFELYDSTSSETTINNLTENVKDLRACIGFLMDKRQNKDVCLVGFQAGAQIACLAAASENRLSAVILAACEPNPSEHIAHTRIKNAGLRYQYKEDIKSYDPINYINHIAPTPLLLQFSHKSETIKKSESIQLSNAAGTPQTVKYYYWNDSGLCIYNISRYDRIKWLMSNVLKIRSK